MSVIKTGFPTLTYTFIFDFNQTGFLTLTLTYVLHWLPNLHLNPGVLTWNTKICVSFWRR
jgi:hypothetical protein